MNHEIDIAGVSAPISRKRLGFEWYGQTTASVCWIASVFASGIDGAGDLLQLLAASAWLTANIATLVGKRRNHHIG